MSTSSNSFEQPATFDFSLENEEKIKAIIAKYPEGRQQSAVMPLLDLAQRQSGGWISRAAMVHIAERLGMAEIRVFEVASFYTMYNLAPIGRHHVQVCTNLPCWLRGSDEIVNTCKNKLGIGMGETTEDGSFTLSEAECLGACVNAPMIQIGDDYYEDLDASSTAAILDAFAAGEMVARGMSQPVA